MAVDLLTSVAELQSLEGEWTELAASSGMPLLQHDWFMSCAETLHDPATLRVFVVRSQGRVTAIAPMACVRRGRVTWLEILGTSALFEPAGLLFENRVALEHLLGAVVGFGYPVLLSRIPASSPIQNVFGSTLRYVPGVHRRVHGSCAVQLGTDWTTFVASMRPKSRSNLRARRRRAEEMGTVRVESRVVSSESCAADLALAFEIESRGWKGESGSSLLQNQRLRAFFERYARRVCPSGLLQLFLLYLDTQPIAMRLALQFGDRLWFLKTGYDEGWAQLSPGLQLTHEMLRLSCQAGLQGCEFLGSEEDWQHLWPVTTHSYACQIACPLTLRGVMGTVDTAVAFAARRVGLQRRVASAAMGPT